jgi:proteic killer suppression protein
VKIRNFLHKGLRRLHDENDPKKELPAPSIDKLRKMMGDLETIEDWGELRNVPVWKAHLLAGRRKGTWSLQVTRNWRMTFWINEAEYEICDVNFEDYH